MVVTDKLSFLILLAILSCASSQRVLYVRPPDGSSPCAGEPCMTFDQYAANPGQFLTFNTILRFSSGIHLLSTSLTVRVDAITFRGEEDTGNKTDDSRLVCPTRSTLAFISSRGVSIESLFLESCGIMFESSNQIRLTNVGFSSSAVSCLSAMSSDVIIGNSAFVNCTSTQGGGGFRAIRSSIEFLGEAIFQANLAASVGGGLYSEGSTIEFMGNANFDQNSARIGGAIYATQNSRIVFHQVSTFTGNMANSSESASGGGGGAVFLSSSHLELRGSSGFERNSVTTPTNITTQQQQPASSAFQIGGGGLKAMNGSRLLVTEHTGFIRNRAPSGGGLVVENSELTISGSALFLNNIAEMGDGGGMYLGENSTTMCAGRLTFLTNEAALSGGSVAVRNARSALIDGGLFLTNTAREMSGGAIGISSCPNVSILNCDLTANMASISGGAIESAHSSLTLGGVGTFDGNTAGTGGGISATNTTLAFTGGHHLEDNTATVFGSGCVQAWWSDVMIGDNTTFMNNKGFHGGCIYAHQSRVEASGSVLFANCSAVHEGGALYASAGGTVSLGGNVTLSGNVARVGGAMTIESGVRMRLISPVNLNVHQNEAELYGGGVYYAEVASALHCTTNSTDLTPFRQAMVPTCFIQTTGSRQNITADFVQNLAGLAGSVLYGGNLENCRTLLDSTAGEQESVEVDLMSFLDISNITSLEDDTTSAISSAPIQMCLCDQLNGMADCSNSVLYVSVPPGRTISIPAVTLGQGGGAVPSRVQVISARGSPLQFTAEEAAQRTGHTCTDLKYRVRSDADSEMLTLHPEGACGDAGTVRIDINVTLLSCPTGFTFSSTTKECSCDSRLVAFDATCDLDRCEVTFPRTRLWVSITSEKEEEEEGGLTNTSRVLVLSEHCPLQYCAPSPNSVIALDSPDEQCLFNRSGTLCGGCTAGYSVVFGSSRCLQCGNEHLALLAAVALGGVALVAVLYVGIATAAVEVQGTVSGLLLYAHLVQINKNALLPPTHSQTNILTVFIAWLNLDLGIESCFYNGMDVYVQTWLQLAFPLYLWLLAGLVASLACCSKKAKKVISPHLVKVFTTLFLLTYVKFLRTAAAGLAVGRIELATSSKLVWRRDGNLDYFRDYRHVILGLVSLLILLVSLVFILLLLCWNVLPKAAKRPGFLGKFVEHLFGPFYPFKLSWVGFLLLCRLYLVVSTIPYTTAEIDTLNMLTAVSTIILVHTLTTLTTGPLYKKKFQGVLEFSFTINLVLFLGATLYTAAIGKATSQGTVASIFLGIAFVEFLGILIYCMYVRFLKGTGLEAKVLRFVRRKLKKEEFSAIIDAEGDRVGGRGRRGRGDGDGRRFDDAHETSFSGGFVVLKKPLLVNSN